LTVRTPELLRADDTVLLVVDVQEGFRTRIAAFDRMVARIRVLALGAGLLDVPVVVTEQYPQGLGPTASELAEALDGAETLEKRSFSAVAAPGFDDLLRRLGRRQALLVGIEAHVCVHQTATDLLRAGLTVHAALDAIESRDPAARVAALARMGADGVHATTVEVQALVKELPAYDVEPVLGTA
jgi:nicotinamidase-related amidase